MFPMWETFGSALKNIKYVKQLNEELYVGSAIFVSVRIF